MRRKSSWWLAGLIVTTVILLADAPAAISQETPRRAEPNNQRAQAPQRDPTLRQLHAADMAEDWIVMRLADAATFYRGMKVKVTTDGTATLSGPVPSEAAKSRVLRIMHRTPGVYSVDYRISIDSSLAKIGPTTTIINDTQLMEKVANSIAAAITGTEAGKDWWFEGWRVKGPDNTWNLVVEVEEPGRVVLDGELPNLDLIRKAIESAVSVPGVHRLDSNLALQPRWHREYYPYDYFPYHYPDQAFAPYRYARRHGPDAASGARE